MKTVRFTQVVARCGKPVPHTQWVDPKKDPALKRAQKEHRVMTLHIQNTGTRKDHGEIGLKESAQRTLLIFPKSLEDFEGKKVVGVDTGLIDQGPTQPRKKTSAQRKSHPPHKVVPARQVPLRVPNPQDEPGEEAAIPASSGVSAASVKKALELLKAYDTSGAIKVLETALAD